jgi:repressor LexA
MVGPQTSAQTATMQSLGTILRERRNDLGLTLQAVADLAGCTKGYLSAIENDLRDRPPSEELLARLEWALRMTPGSLVAVGDWQSTPDAVRRRVRDLETQEQAGRRLASLLRDQGIDALHRSGELRRLVERLTNSPPASTAPSTTPPRRPPSVGTSPPGAVTPWGGIGAPRTIPMQVPLINKVAAGYPTEFTDLAYPARVADEYVSVPDINDADAFAARVVGDSMEPAYREGDIVVFSPAAPTHHGSDCFVRFERDEETTFKRVFFEPPPAAQQALATAGSPATQASPASAATPTPSSAATLRLRLQPLNPKYPPRTVGREEIAGLYAAVYVVRPVGLPR